MQTLVTGTLSSWAGTSEMPLMPPISSHMAAGICIVGAGIAGLSTAYMLLREGRDVLVIDAGQPGGGETGRSSAHLSSSIDDGYVEIEKIHGRHGSHLAYMSHAAAIDTIEEIVNREHIECDFRRVNGYLFQGAGERAKSLDEEFGAAHRAGMFGIEMLPSAPGGTLGFGRCARYPRQAEFHPLKYLAGLAKAIQRLGGRIHSDARVLDVKHVSENEFEVSTEAGWMVRSPIVVAATNSPITSLVSIHTKQAAYRSYVMALRIPRGSVPAALYWDTDVPYHYVRVQVARFISGEDLLIIGGEDHKTGQDESPNEDAHFDRIRQWAAQHFPMAKEEEYRWSGQIQETNDGLAFLGRSPGGPSNLYIATGDSGNGLTHGTIAGMLLADQINGRVSPWEELYDPSRIRAGAIGKWLKENLNVAKQFTDYAVTPGDEKTVGDILPDTGAVIIEDGHRIAVHRDSHGTLHRRSAVCTHLGGLVHWNAVEKTWDCPCHGSRFTPDGTVLNGPASHSLDEVT